MPEVVKVFQNEELGEVRMVNAGDELWFCAKDILVALGYSQSYVGNVPLAIAHVPEEWAGRYRISVSSSNGTEQMREMVFLSEQGLYFFLGRSDKPKAVQYQKWIAGDVIPSIRKHGLYAKDEVIDKMLSDPDWAIMLFTELKTERAARKAAEEKNAILMHVNKTYTMTEIAKELNMRSAMKLNQKLADKKIQYKVGGTWVMYSDYSDLGYENIKQEVLDNGKVIYHRKITQSGREFILNLFEKETEAQK